LLAMLISATARAQVEPLSGGMFEIYVDSGLTTPGLAGSYVDQNLGNYTPHDDWRITQTVAGTRVDQQLSFIDTSWGLLAEVGLTGGSDADWDNFSVQWDGYIKILTNQMQIATVSDDSSRMWIDLNGDGQFDSSGSEFVNNHWGTPQAPTQGELSVPLDVGVYAIRIQYEESFFGNVMQLISPAPETVRIAYLIPSNRVPQTEGVANLQQFVEWMRDWMCEQMDRNGVGPLSMRIETESDGITPRIHVVNVAETDDYLRGDIWGRVSAAAGAVGVPIWTPGQVWLLVPEIHEQQSDGSILGGVALGASFGSGSDPGVAMIGSVLLALGPQSLTDDRLYDGLVVPEIGPVPLVQDVSFPWFEGSSLSSVTSSGLGAMMHEWLHGLGMPHDFRNDGNFHGNVMGNGLRGMRGSLFPQNYFLDDTRLAYGAALALQFNRYLMVCNMMAPPGPVQAAPRAADEITLGLPSGVDRTGAERHLLGEALPHPSPPSLPETRGAGSTAGCNDLVGPTVQILTSGTVDPINGLLRIEFSATDDVQLATALLRRQGDLISELQITGTNATGVFETPYYSTTQSDTYSISVYDTCSNRTDAEVGIIVNSGLNRAPQPFFSILKSWTTIGADVLFDAGGTTDPDHANSTIEIEWDFDDDGVYDTMPTTTKTHSISFNTPGARRVRMRSTDPAGAQSVSTAIALRIEEVCPSLASGDMNCDGSMNGIDISAFVLAIIDPNSYAAQFPGCSINNGDIDCDGIVGLFDIGPFTQLLIIE